MPEHKPRLTGRVMEGLTTLAGFVGAGASDDILGFDYDTADAEQRRSWDDIVRACEWIRDMQQYRATRRPHA